LNEPTIKIGSPELLKLEGSNVSKLHSQATKLVEEDLNKVRNHLLKYARV
jgi:hypothetical protein